MYRRVPDEWTIFPPSFANLGIKKPLNQWVEQGAMHAVDDHSRKQANEQSRRRDSFASDDRGF